MQHHIFIAITVFFCASLMSNNVLIDNQVCTLVKTESGDVYIMGSYKNFPFEKFEKTDPCPRRIQFPHSSSGKIIHMEGNLLGYFFYSDEGEVWVVGSNMLGQLGLNHTKNVTTPTRFYLPNKANISRIYSKNHSSFVFDKQGDVWAFGDNRSGKLGLPNSEGLVDTPQKLTLPNKAAISEVIIGYECTFFIDKDRHVWGAGLNIYNQLGLGNIRNFFAPQILNVSFRSPIKQIVASNIAMGTFFVNELGEVWVHGQNSSGNLGVGHRKPVSLPEQISFSETENVKIHRIVAGTQATFFFDSQGRVWAAGFNGFYQLGLGNNNDNVHFPQLVTLPNNRTITQVVAGEYSTFFMDEDNNFWAAGLNKHGHLGIGQDQKEVKIPQLIKLPEQATIAQIFTAGSSTVFIDTCGQIWVAGRNDLGKLGFDSDEISPPRKLQFVRFLPVGSKKHEVKNPQPVKPLEQPTIFLSEDRQVFVGSQNFPFL